MGGAGGTVLDSTDCMGWGEMRKGEVVWVRWSQLLADLFRIVVT